MTRSRLSGGPGMAECQRQRSAQVPAGGEGEDASVGGAGRDRLALSPERPPGTPLPTVGLGARRVLDFIARAERTTPEFAGRFGFASDYDVPFNYGRSAPPTAKPLSQMTLGEVAGHQQRMKAGGSTAVGRYQVKASTLGELRDKHGLGNGRLFDGALQDQLGRSLMRNRKYDAYCVGQAPADEVMDALASEWASLPMADGLSRYGFKGRRQPVRATRSELKAVLDEACRLDFGPPPARR